MKYFYTFLTALSLFLFDTEILFAGTEYQPLAPIIEGSEGGIDFATYMVGMFNLAIGIAAVLAVVFIVIGGIQYMSTDAYSGKTDGKERIQNALLGLLLAISAYTILYNINPDLAMVNFDLSGVNSPTDITNDFAPAVPTQVLRNVFPSGTVSSVYHSGGVIVQGSGPFTFNTSGTPAGLQWVQRTEEGRTAYNLVGTPTTEGDYTVTVTAVNKDGVETIIPSTTIKIHPVGQFVPKNQNLYPDFYSTSDINGGTGYYRRLYVDFWWPYPNAYYTYGPYTDENGQETCEADGVKAVDYARRTVSQDYGEKYVGEIKLRDCVFVQ